MRIQKALRGNPSDLWHMVVMSDLKTTVKLDGRRLLWGRDRSAAIVDPVTGHPLGGFSVYPRGDGGTEFVADVDETTRPYVERVWAYLQQLGFSELPAQLPAPGAEQPATPGVKQAADPLEVITDVKTRELVRLWNAGETAEDVGEQVGRSAGTVRNIITRLRNEYGRQVVRYHRT
jgi:hypothetical protein